MSKNRIKCDRCGAGENWAILSGGFFEISFSSNSLTEALNLRNYFDLCHSCFEDLKRFMNVNKPLN